MDFNLDTLKSIGTKLMDVVPSLAGAVLSPNPVTVLTAFNSIRVALGLSNDANEKAIDDALTTMTPEIRLSMIQAQNSFKEEMGRQDLERYKASLVDVQSARGMNVETVKATGKTDRQLSALSWVIIIGFLLAISSLFWFAWSGREVKDSTGILFMLVGQLATFAGMVMTFRFGTTAESGRKTTMLSKVGPVPEDCAEKK